MNPLLGRWISADPLAIHSPGNADLNLYAYVRGYVLKAIDPLGLEDEKAGGPADGPSGVDAIDQVMQEMDRLEFELDPAEAYAAAERQNERNTQEYAEVREAEAFEERVQAVMSGKGGLTPESFGSPEVVEATRRVEEEASRAPIDPLLEKIEQDYGIDLKPLTEGLGLIAGFFGKGSPKVKAPGASGAAVEAVSSRATRRQAMREAGIPTSQQPVEQASVRAGHRLAGRQYTYEIPAAGGGTRIMSVQHSLTDRVPDHGPHWEAGPVKPGGQKDSLGRPRLTSDKVKVDE